MNSKSSFESNSPDWSKSWFSDAKLGIMVSWGLYSVPAWAPLDPRLYESLGGEILGDGGRFSHLSPMSTTSYSEWYLNSMSLIGTPTWFYHQAVYGGMPYDEFRPEFELSAAGADVASWVDLTLAAGARYIIPLTKHHDGYMLYPSDIPSPFRRGYGLTRDVIGEIASAARARGLRFGAYYSGGIDWAAAGLPIAHAEQLTDETREQLTRRLWPKPYGSYADAHYREIIERYEPDILWNDIGYPEDGKAAEMFEFYYGRVPHGVVNDRFMESHHDFRTPEYHAFSEIQPDAWEMARGVGRSFGLNRQETAADTLSGNDLVELLIRVVARNGNLLLGIGPDASGNISDLQRKSLLELGAWLSINGDAIYGTRPWVPAISNSAAEIYWVARGSDRFALLPVAGTYRLELDSSLDPSAAMVLGDGPQPVLERLADGTDVLVVRNPGGAKSIRFHSR